MAPRVPVCIQLGQLGLTLIVLREVAILQRSTSMGLIHLDSSHIMGKGQRNAMASLLLLSAISNDGVLHVHISTTKHVGSKSLHLFQLLLQALHYLFMNLTVHFRTVMLPYRTHHI
jgi:hypothetical protein